jgi:hypothetical protein
MPKAPWLQGTSPAFRLMIATSWLAPPSWQDHQEEAIREAIEANVDWIEYVRLVDRHRTPALSWAALKRVPGLKIPAPASNELQRRSEACRMQALRHSSQLAEILKAFNRAGISILPFKGPTLSVDLYSDLGLRHSKDLDLAVAREDLSRAQACLENLGWSLDSMHQSLSPRQLQSHFRIECNLVFEHPSKGGHLELHWRNQWETSSQTSARWARCTPSIWQGRACLVMDPNDKVLYLCSHGGRHAWFRAKWLGDLARVHALRQIDWQVVQDQAQSVGQERSLLSGLLLLQEVYGLQLPELSGNPYKDVPSFLVNSPLRAMKVTHEPGGGDALEGLRETLRWKLHDRLAQPSKKWRASLAEAVYCPADFQVLRLPDRLYWAYAPLRPVLWAWRLALRRRLAR